MKKWCLILILLCLRIITHAQDNEGYYLSPNLPSTIDPNQSVAIHLLYTPMAKNDPINAESGAALSTFIVQWTVNGKKINELNPADGKVKAAHGFDLSTITYTAPEVTPAKNPVAIAVQVKTKDHSLLWLVYNVKIVEAQYKITLDAEQTLPMAGQDIKLHGECFANLKATANGTYFLEPIDKTRNIQVTVEKGILAEKDGGYEKLIAPFSYTFPFLFEIDKMDKNHPISNGTMNLYYTSPQSGKVVWDLDGQAIQTIDIDKGTLYLDPPGMLQQLGTAGNPTLNAISMSAVTQLNLIASYNRTNINNTMDNVDRNTDNSGDMMVFAKRMQAHENDPNYFKTKQGRADMQKLMALRKKVGGNISGTSALTQKLNNSIDKNYANDPNYAGSKKMYSDAGKLKASEIAHNLTHNETSMAQVAPGNALLRIEGKFNPKSQQAFYQEIKGASLGGGEQQTVFKIKVVKIQ